MSVIRLIGFINKSSCNKEKTSFTLLKRHKIYIISQKWLEKKFAEKTIKIISEVHVIIIRYVQL
jgi:hypothetical protein